MNAERKPHTLSFRVPSNANAERVANEKSTLAKPTTERRRNVAIVIEGKPKETLGEPTKEGRGRQDLFIPSP